LRNFIIFHKKAGNIGYFPLALIEHPRGGLRMKWNIWALPIVMMLFYGSTCFAMEGASHEGVFTYETVEKGIRGDFQIMTLASMNMKDPEGKTHHVMLKLFEDGSDRQMKEATGKVVITSPTNKRGSVPLKNYNGIFAANFTFDEPGKYGVACLINVGKKELLFRFLYPHGK
jgi:hypothetical protein